MVGFGFEVLGVKVTHEGCQRLLDGGSACTGQSGLGFATRCTCILHICVFVILDIYITNMYKLNPFARPYPGP